MDVAATPGMFLELNEKIVNSIEISLKYENIIYNLKIYSNNEYLYLEINNENNINFFYEVKFGIMDLIQLDKMFKICDNINDAYNLLLTNIQNNKTFIKKITEVKLILIINILQGDSSKLEKEIILTKKYQKNEIVIEELTNEIKELKIIQNKLENEISELKTENQKLKEQNLQEEIEALKNKLNNYFDDSIIKSTIIPDLTKFNFIKERLNKVNIEGQTIHKINFELLYRAKRHGDRAKDFHLRCDMYQNTLTIIKTEGGLIFGGFTSQSWEGKDSDKEDENAFCFSLDKQKIYNSIKGKKAIYANPNQGPSFQNCIFEIKDKFFENGGNCDSDVKSHYDNIEEEFEINGGDNHFLVEDLEVFAVYFE